METESVFCKYNLLDLTGRKVQMLYLSRAIIQREWYRRLIQVSTRVQNGFRLGKKETADDTASGSIGYWLLVP